VAALASTAPDDAWEHGVLFAVADGMGGHAAGEVASRLAVETATDTWKESSAGVLKGIRQAMTSANLTVFDRAGADPTLRGMGTTLTMTTLSGSEAVTAHVGDSRAYLVRDREIRQLTVDHSRVMEMLRMRLITPEQARSHPARSMLTRSLGAEPLVQVDVVRVPTREDDVLVLCTDGLWDVVSREEIAAAVSATPREACDALIDLAVTRGAPDNVSALVIHVTSPLPIPTGPRRPGRRTLWRRG
jgi:PPM family protein phosphatase